MSVAMGDSRNVSDEREGLKVVLLIVIAAIVAGLIAWVAQW
jgi:hypothetical protein